MQLNINSNKRFQTFEGFGASGAWWAQMVGTWTHPDADGVPVRDKISSLLFSKTDGIGLDIYRYNIGGGSVHSGRGTATITAEIINADGATVTATKEISCTMTLWQRIVRWFKGLFGAARLMKAIEH